MQVFASDADDPNTVNAQLKFSIVNQIPNLENIPFYFGINPDNGEIFITEQGTPTHLEQKYMKNLNVHVICICMSVFSLNAKLLFCYIADVLQEQRL